MMQKKLRRAELEQRYAAAAELAALRNALARAYAVFNRTDDPELLEASILEIGALRSRCDCVLRGLKSMNGEPQNVSARKPAGRRVRADCPDAEATAQTYQMGL